jgi:hypothetical protein
MAMINLAGGAAAEGQRGAASPRGFGGATPCRGSRRRRGTRLGVPFAPLWGAVVLAVAAVAAERFCEAKSSEYPYLVTLTPPYRLK